MFAGSERFARIISLRNRHFKIYDVVKSGEGETDVTAFLIVSEHKNLIKLIFIIKFNILKTI